MPCYYPIKAFRSASGDVEIVAGSRLASISNFAFPCGRCIGCRLEVARGKAMRMVHEAKLWKWNSFVTLTYDEQHMPVNGTLVPEDLQKFLKRLRFALSPRKIRFAAVGEYGEQTWRPHYHLAVFNEDFSRDRWEFARGNGDNPVYRSPLLESCWKLGLSSIGDLTPESAEYIAGYVVKKVTGDLAEYYYEGRQPEFWRSSSRPGLGAGWVAKFGRTDVWPFDRVVYKGREVRPPRYYDKLLKRADSERYLEVKDQRMERALERALDNTPQRLQAKETVAKAALSLKRRKNLK